MNNELLLGQLSTLRKHRSSLLENYCDAQSELYLYLWRYHRSSAVMDVAMDYVRISWLNTLKELLGSQLQGIDPCHHVQYRDVIKNYQQLVVKLTCSKSNCSDDEARIRSDLFFECADDILKCLEGMMDFHTRSEDGVKRVCVTRYKHKELFHRKLDSLSDNKINGDD